MQTNAPALPRSVPGEMFSFEKSVYGDVTVLSLRGTLNDAFDGRKIADAIKTRKAIITMRDVRRFASWGMTEWMELLRLRHDRDIYLAECSTYAVSQINLITGLLGHAKLTSFYASYRCGSCGAELEQLFVIPNNTTAILELPNRPHRCGKCNGVAMLEAYPAAFFETIASRPSFDIDDDVLAVLQQKFRYEIVQDATRFRAFRAVDGEEMYLRLSGDITRLPAEIAQQVQASTLIDMRGVLFDPRYLDAWHRFLDGALARATIQLDGVPESFLEYGTSDEHLHGKLRIRSFDARYDCLTCETAVARPVDVAEHLEQLVEGTLPPAHCPTCRSALVPAPQPGLAQRMRALPARDRSQALDKLVTRVQAWPSSKLENCLAPARPAPAKQKSAAPYLLAGLAVAGAGAAVAYVLATRSESEPARSQVATPAAPSDAQAKPQFVRPDWIISDTPASAYCHDLINRLMCVGVSSYRTTKDLAAAEANDAALEELVNAVGIKIIEPSFRERVVPAYNEVRAKQLGALATANLERQTDKYESLAKSIAQTRSRAVRILQTSGGPAVPAQRSDWYWEEYAGDGGVNDVLAFVRYDVSLDAVRSLVDTYGRNAPFFGGTARNGFPATAWNAGDFEGGIVLTKLGGRLRTAKLAVGDVITSVNDAPVGDVDLATKLVEDEQKAKRPVNVTVVTPGQAPRTVQLR